MVWEEIHRVVTNEDDVRRVIYNGNPNPSHDSITVTMYVRSVAGTSVSKHIMAPSWSTFDFAKYRYAIFIEGYEGESKCMLENIPNKWGILFDNILTVPARYSYFIVARELKNTAPNVTLNTPNNTTLYEAEKFLIDGTAKDTDNGNIVNVRYQINAGTIRAMATGISDGTTAIPFNKQLTFKGGILYDGATAITTNLAEGVAHTLKVWAEDDQGGKSVVEERTFYVVPNRPPALTIDPFTAQSDLINADKITFSGTSSDPDGNEVRVSYKLNNGLATQIHAGPGAPWTFDLMLKNLIDGENIVIIEVIDSYNFKSSKTLKFNKTKVRTPLLKSTVRQEIISPSGSAKGVLLWIQRHKDLTVIAEASMKLAGEQEQYLPMTLRNSAPVTETIMEDEHVIETVGPQQKIFIKLDISRLNTTIDPAVTLISGVLNQ